MDGSINNVRELRTGGGGESEREPARIVRVGGSSHLKPVNLALRGGGAHGAFAWGVLDRLLEEKRIAFDGISATSAGAINATVLVSGLVAGGRQGAKTRARQTLAPDRPSLLADPAAASPIGSAETIHSTPRPPSCCSTW
jgi:predicted acylesterase/phospholipase RssA